MQGIEAPACSTSSLCLKGGNSGEWHTWERDERPAGLESQKNKHLIPIALRAPRLQVFVAEFPRDVEHEDGRLEVLYWIAPNAETVPVKPPAEDAAPHPEPKAEAEAAA